tara:strand:+ start:32664 stop:33437 length:774 start_codon:yes stop_codon:yes gene_type:complete
MSSITRYTKNLIPYIFTHSRGHHKVTNIYKLVFSYLFKKSSTSLVHLKFKNFGISLYSKGSGFTEVFCEKIYDANNNKKNPVIYDLGAHVGVYSIWCVQNFASPKIFSYEAFEGTYDICKKNIDPFSDKISLKNVGITDEVGEAIITVGSHMGSNFVDFNASKVEGELDHKIITSNLDTEMAKNGTDYIDILKMDIEGSEIRALKGVNLNKVGSIVLEYHFDDKGKKLEEILGNTHKLVFYEEYSDNTSLIKYEPLK